MAHYFTINHEQEFIAVYSPKCGCTVVKPWFMAPFGAGDADHEPAWFRENRVPTVPMFFDAGLIESVEAVYAEDCAYYHEHSGMNPTRGLLAPHRTCEAPQRAHRVEESE